MTATEEIITHSTIAFTWIPAEKKLVAERSDFKGRGPWTVVQEGPVKTSYCYLHNAITGNSVLCVLQNTLESEGPDSEIEAWVFGPTPEETEKNPRLFGLQVIFLND
jgi:hypothetical protein